VKAIRSIRDQTYQTWETWIVDDGSLDGTEQALRPMLGDPRLHYVYQENQGVSAARNTGIGLCHGVYVAFLDSDDLAWPSRLETQAAFLDAHADVDVVFTDVWKVYPDDVRHRFVDRVPGFRKAIATYRRGDVAYVIPARTMLAQALVAPPVKPSTIMVRRSAIDRFGAFNECIHRGQSLEFLLRFAGRGARFGFIDEPLVDLSVWEGCIHLLESERSFESAISLLKSARDVYCLDPAERALASQGIALQYFTLGKYLHEHRRRPEACWALLRGLTWSRDPSFLAHAAAVWLPESALKIARRLRHSNVGGLIKET
jgi:glycosyltransferase involved in cell wall biosynthesis